MTFSPKKPDIAMSQVRFSNNIVDNLAYLYLQNQDISNLTPAEFYRKFIIIRDEINKEYLSSNKDDKLSHND